MINPPDKSESQNQANENPVDSKFTRAALGITVEGLQAFFDKIEVEPVWVEL